ncbi:hypothetical protein [Xenorhabdus kozodoii]|uniref:Uncharacterized protein n=1 Tax=Xenorhabdus kozodoii TaxID=351676 RepID=A0A2D0LC75_9GAMM|nr:hypothetical protein [Xenorhabdus kozodoii]PHM73260.1 hypothetical protein Xkoz_02151 [Xenorhabdus kozodoii]
MNKKEGSNLLRELCFSGKCLDAFILYNPKKLHIDRESLIINPSGDYIIVHEDINCGIPPLSSANLCNVHISSCSYVILIKKVIVDDIIQIKLEHGWTRFEKPDEKIPISKLELWFSSQDTVGTVDFSLFKKLSPHIKMALGKHTVFDLKLNLWLARSGTHCLIHNEHDFLEIHTQIIGIGHMQKFHSNSFKSIYEDITMPPGFTTSQPFCIGCDNGNDFYYPWHQYYAETDCIWMAIEYHPRK